jgi:hypothetical protein
MTAKNYIAIARIIKEEWTYLPFDLRMSYESFANKMCEMFAKDNPNFDKDRFLVACGF